MKRMGEFFDLTQIFQDIARAAAAGQAGDVLRFSLGGNPEKIAEPSSSSGRCECGSVP